MFGFRENIPESVLLRRTESSVVIVTSHYKSMECKCPPSGYLRVEASCLVVDGVHWIRVEVRLT